MILVSVIIPTYNRKLLLKRALLSVFTQSFKNLEIIVVDDCSDDNTIKIVRELNDERVKYIRNTKNLGGAVSRNIGIKNANGKYIAFLDDDDEWLSTKIEKQVAIFESKKNVGKNIGLVYCWMQYYQNKKKINKTKTPSFKGNIFNILLSEQAIGATSTILIKKDIVKTIGFFDKSLKRGQDGDYIRRIARHYNIDYVPEILVNYHRGHGRISVNTISNSKKATHELLVRLNKFSESFKNNPLEYKKVLIKIIGHYAIQLNFYGVYKYLIKYFKIKNKNFFYNLLLIFFYSIKHVNKK